MITLLALLLSAPLGAEEAFVPVVEDLPNGGRIDWTSLRLEVSAGSDITIGAWKDRRVQEQDALDRLSPAIAKLAARVCVTPGSTAGDLMDGSSELATRLQEALHSWKIDETRYHSKGSVELDAALDLQAWLRPALTSLATSTVPPLPADAATGLVIDTRGLPFEPCLAPTVLQPDGTAIMRAQLLGEEAANLSTPVAYVSDPADPRVWKRVGDRPYLARAATVHSHELVLDPATAAGLPPETAALVARGKVVMVVEP